MYTNRYTYLNAISGVRITTSSFDTLHGGIRNRVCSAGIPYGALEETAALQGAVWRVLAIEIASCLLRAPF